MCVKYVKLYLSPKAEVTSFKNPPVRRDFRIFSVFRLYLFCVMEIRQTGFSRWKSVKKHNFFVLNTFQSDEHKGVKILIFDNFGLREFLRIFRFFAHNFFVRQYFQNRISPSETVQNFLQLLYWLLFWETFREGRKMGKTVIFVINMRFLIFRAVVEEFTNNEKCRAWNLLQLS